MVGKSVHRQERDKLYTNGQAIKTNKKHGTHQIENKHAKNIKKTLFYSGLLKER